MKASKLTARGLAYVVRGVGRKIAKHHRAKQTPHGKQSVKKLMAHGASASSIELSGDTAPPGINLKQMAAALQFMQEHQISEYDQLTTEAEAASARFHVLTEQLRQTEADLAHTSELMGAVVQYAKTRPVFDEYKAVKYSKRFLAQHEAELADYRAAKAALNDLLDGAKLPKMAQLKEKRRKLAAEKKALYAKYRAAQQEMRQAVAVKTNIDHLLGVTDGRKNKEQER